MFESWRELQSCTLFLGLASLFYFAYNVWQQLETIVNQNNPFLCLDLFVEFFLFFPIALLKCTSISDLMQYSSKNALCCVVFAHWLFFLLKDFTSCIFFFTFRLCFIYHNLKVQGCMRWWQHDGILWVFACKNTFGYHCPNLGDKELQVRWDSQ